LPRINRAGLRDPAHTMTRAALDAKKLVRCTIFLHSQAYIEKEIKTTLT
jgi:hypothetical protein